MAENENPKPTHELDVVAEKHAAPTHVAKEQDQLPAPKSSVRRIVFSLTTISFILSFPILFCVVWLLYVREGNCGHLPPLPKLQVGLVVGLIVLFVTSNGVVFLRSRFLMLGLIVVMVPLIVILTIGLALIGAYTESRMIPGSPPWLRMMVNNNSNWKAIESCIYNTRTCQDLALQSSVIGSYNFSRRHLSPIESGCCIPPSPCDMNYVNVTFWERKTEVYDDGSNGLYVDDIDCDLWQNSVTKLCYGCYACRKGFIETLRQKWYKLGVVLVVVTILLIVFHLLLFVAKMWERYAS